MMDSTVDDDEIAALDRVAAGWLWLDEHLGTDWPQLIDLDTFQITSECNCVLGQTIAHIVDAAGVDRTALIYDEDQHPDEPPLEDGFSLVVFYDPASADEHVNSEALAFLQARDLVIDVTHAQELGFAGNHGRLPTFLALQRVWHRQITAWQVEHAVLIPVRE